MNNKRKHVHNTYVGRKRIFYISDLHLFHKMSLKVRPYDNIDEMHNDIIYNWRKKVGANDTVYILGDVTMYHPQEAADILRILPGIKILVQGNHDIFNLDDPSFRHSFAKVKSYMDIVDNGRRVVLTHYPMEDWNGMHRGFYHVHGHTHKKVDNLRKMKRRYNAVADYLAFTPHTLDELIRLYD